MIYKRPKIESVFELLTEQEIMNRGFREIYPGFTKKIL
jgi:hypothetical protein